MVRAFQPGSREEYKHYIELQSPKRVTVSDVCEGQSAGLALSGNIRSAPITDI
jgi:hypothetical protein